MTILQRGCFCCSVRTCVLVQGWTFCITATIMVIINIAMYPYVDALYQGGSPTEDRLGIWSYATKILTICFVCTLLWTAVQYTMLVGIYKKRAWMLVPHLVLSALLTLGLTIAVLLNHQTGTNTVLFVVLFDCIQTYFWFHVFSHYLDLKRVATAVSPI